MELGWQVLPHPLYPPDLGSSDYHLFRSLRNFDDQDHLELDFGTFFRSHSKKSYEDGIMDLPKRWKYVADNGGIYTTN